MDGTAPHGQVRIALRDVGSRVVVRYRLPEGDHGPFGESLTDVIGELLSFPVRDGEDLIVQRPDGGQVRIPPALVVAAKPLPPPPKRRGGASGSPEER